jgi:hypothetical protein
MKRIFLASSLFAAMGLFLTGCLKDKGFDNHEYGINDPDTQPPGVGFPLGAKAKNTVGLNVEGTPQVIDDVVYVNLNSGSPAPSDIEITLTVNSVDLVAAYNALNGTAIEVLDPSLYSVATTLTIPAGARNVQVPITVPSTLSLDPNKSYGIGLTITGVSGNYKIADNMKNLLVEFTIKNKYDGRYRLRGYHNRTPYTFPYDTEIHMVTAGPSSVAFYWPLAGSVGHPIGVGANNAMSWYGPTVAPVVVFDLSTNLVTNVYNSDPAGPVITMFTGAGSRVSKWNPADKSMIVDWNYNNNALRAFFDDLTYIGPR